MPKIRWDYTSSEVLTMEYCPGVKINRISELDRLGLDRQRLARLSVESYLQQLVRKSHFPALSFSHPASALTLLTIGFTFTILHSVPSSS